MNFLESKGAHYIRLCKETNYFQYINFVTSHSLQETHPISAENIKFNTYLIIYTKYIMHIIYV